MPLQDKLDAFKADSQGGQAAVQRPARNPSDHGTRDR